MNFLKNLGGAVVAFLAYVLVALCAWGVFCLCAGCGLADGRLDDDDLNWMVEDPQPPQPTPEPTPEPDLMDTDQAQKDECAEYFADYGVLHGKATWAAHKNNAPAGYTLATRKQMLEILADPALAYCGGVFWTATEAAQLPEMACVVGHGWDFEANKTLEFRGLFVAE